MTPIYTKIIILLCFMLMASANSEETLSKNVAHKIHQNSEPSTMLEDTAAGSRFPEVDPELVVKLNEYTENENAIFLENRKKAREARAAAAKEDNVEVATKQEDRFPQLDPELDAKLYEQIFHENEAFRENRKKIRAAKAAAATQKEQEVRTSRGLRGSRN